MTNELLNSLSKDQKMSFFSNRIRGIIINSFIAIEYVIADMVVVVDRNCDYLEYYKEFKPTNRIFKDFIKCYDKLRPIADKYFTDKETLKNDLGYLVEIRNRAAHALWINDEYAIGTFDAEHYYFFSIHFANEECKAMSEKMAIDYQLACMSFLGPLSAMQKEVYSTLSVVPVKKTSKEKIALSEEVTVPKVFNSLK